MNNISEKKGGVALSYIQMILNVLMKFVYTPFLLKALGQNEYGLFSLTMSIVGYLAILDMGFGATVTRYAVKYRSEGDRESLYKLYSTLSVIYVIIGALSLVLCLLLSNSAEAIFGQTMTIDEVGKLKIMIFLCGINLLFTFPLQISVSVIAAHERFIFKNTIVLLRTILQPIVLILLLYFVNIKSIGAIVTVTTFNFLNYFVYYLYSVKRLDFKFYLSKFTPKMIPDLLTFSGWMFALMVFEQIQFNSGQFIIGMYQNSAVVAVWGIAMIFVLNYRSLSTAITNVFMPTFLSITFNNKQEELETVSRRIVHIQSTILYFILFNFYLFGSQFIHIWAGGEYDESYICALIVIAPMTLSLILDFSYLYQMATKMLKYRVFTFFGCMIFSFVVTFYYIGINLLSFSLMMSISILLGQVFFVILFIKKRMKLDIAHIFRKPLINLFSILVLTVAYYFFMSNSSLFQNEIVGLISHVIIYNIILTLIMWHFVLDGKDKSIILRIKV